LILLRKTNENSVHSKFPFAAKGGGILFTQPHDKGQDSILKPHGDADTGDITLST